MTVGLISTLVSIVVGVIAIGATIVRAIYADARQRDAIESLTVQVKELAEKVDRIDERVWKNALRSKTGRGKLPGG